MLYESQGSVFLQLANENLTTGINDFVSINFEMYPNPATDKVTFDFSQLPRNKTRIILTDITGKQLISQNVQSNHEILNIHSIPAGIYLVTIVSGNNQKIEKLIVN